MGLFGRFDRIHAKGIEQVLQSYASLFHIAQGVFGRVGPSGKAGGDITNGDNSGVDKLDGVTVELSETPPVWFNVRASNTEPLLRLNAEAPTRAEVDAIVEEVLGIIRA